MGKDIDKSWITDEFLLKYFYDRNQYPKISANEKQSLIALLEDQYLALRKDIERARGGLTPLPDRDIKIVLEKAKGRVYLPKI